MNIEQFTSMRATVLLKSPTGKKEIFTLSALKKTNLRSTLLKDYRDCPKCCHAWAGATTAVKSPGLCQSRVTAAPWAWGSANKTTASSTS